MKATIYKLYNPDYPEFYVGSTIQIFKKRKISHKSDCTNENCPTYNTPVYKYIREHGGWDSWKFEILEENDYEDNIAKLKRERYFMETLKATLNNNIPGRTIAEYFEDNKEKLLKRQALYRKNNKEKIAKIQLKWKKNNQDKVKASKASKEESRQKNKDKYKKYKAMKAECKYCKSILRKVDLAIHQKTMKCITLQLFNF